MHVNKTLLVLIILAGALLTACKSGETQDASLADMTREIANKPDSLKVKQLLEARIPMDSVAVIVTKMAIGEVPGVNIDNLADIDAFLYMNRSEKDYEVYTLAMDSYSKKLPLSKRFRLYKKSPLIDKDKLGYQLGLEYVSDVIDRKLTIGKVDKEIAEFRRECGEDEDTYNRFLKAFQVGINTRSPEEIPADIRAEYGK
ncbi:MAG: hypothetical protein HDS66_09670 [Bacteroidales bacterium]|nr:hypothetical protein [Bacteroidales bacterium]